MLRGKVKDSADSLFNILNQPLDISGVSENMSLWQAIQNYSSQQPEHSDLSKMLRAFAANPGSTQALIQELELIANDLTVS